MKEKIKNNIFWIIAIIIIILLLLFLVIDTKNKKNESNTSTTSTSEVSESSDEEMLSGKHQVIISVKNYGDIKVELDADVAPITVTNFIDLAKSDFYNGLTFHRIIEGFMIQGGDPEGTGMGGSGKTIKGEFSANGVNNTISHVRGTISMARSSSYDSASSQFFIVQEDATYLDGNYAAFGKVTEGMDVVDKIASDAKPTDDNGTIPKDEQPVIESITVIN